MKKIVIVGYGTAGMTAAAYVRTINRATKIIVFEKRAYAVYHPCSIPDVLSGYISSWESIKEEPPRIPNMEVKVSTIVEEIDVDSRRVIARDLRSGERIIENFDTLVLSTGSRPYIPSTIKIEDSDEVFTLKTIEDGLAIEEAAKKYSKAIVIGGSALGIEVAHALRKRGLEIILVEYFPHLMYGRLDHDMSSLIEKYLIDEGIKLVLGREARAIEGRGGAKKVYVDGGVHEGGFVVMATGVKPNVELAQSIGLEIGNTGGIRVDDTLRTSVPYIFAAGDNTEVRDLVTGQPTLSPFASTAIMMGRVAGINAAGGDEVFKGVTNVWIVNLGGLKFGGVGISEEIAKKLGIEYVSVRITVPEKLHIYPDATDITIKLIIHRDDGRVLGGQVLGLGEVTEKLNLLSLFIAKRATVDDLVKIETAYTPSICEVMHPLHTAADAILRRLRRKLA